MLEKFTDWVLGLIKDLFGFVWDFLTDLVIAIFSALCQVLVALLQALPGSDGLSAGLQAFYGQLDPGIVYVLTAVHMPQALALIGSAFVFRVGRKVVTLFQW